VVEVQCRAAATLPVRTPHRDELSRPGSRVVPITLDLLRLFGLLLETMPRVALVLTSAVSRSQRHSSLAEPSDSGGGLQ